MPFLHPSYHFLGYSPRCRPNGAGATLGLHQGEYLMSKKNVGYSPIIILQSVAKATFLSLIYSTGFSPWQLITRVLIKT